MADIKKTANRVRGKLKVGRSESLLKRKIKFIAFDISTQINFYE